MRERLRELTVRGFRAVAGELPVDFGDGQSMIVLGANGTGKSTIADAVEFYFTGRIKFLAAEGRDFVHHAAVDRDAVAVEIVTSGTIGGTCSREQFVSGALAAGSSETFLLRGRDLAEFVDKTKGEKYNHLLGLLGLESVNKLRLDLQTARNRLERDRQAAESNRDAAVTHGRALHAGTSLDDLLAAIRSACGDAGIESAPATIEAALAREWTADYADRETLVKRAAQLRTLGTSTQDPPALPPKNAAVEWNRLLAGPAGSGLVQQRVVDAAADYVRVSEINACPVCEQPVNVTDLRERLVRRLADMQTANQEFQRAERDLSVLINRMETAWAHRAATLRSARQLTLTMDDLPTSPVSELRRALERRVVIDIESASEAVAQLRSWDEAAAKVVVDSIPAVSPQDEALVRLVLLVDLGMRRIAADRELQRATAARELADRLHDDYSQRVNDYLTGVVEAISGRAAEIYRALHPEEGLDNIAMEMVGEKGAELAVDFHGQRHRPPSGVLSESHLNSLGIALFLAMAETFNERLGFVVLDDVVNSFDGSHRGRLADFLTSDFPDHQLIVLTHDPVFFEQLRRKAPHWRTAEFTSWTYEEGPRRSDYDAHGFVARARTALAEGDLHGAATKARRALEEVLQEVCEGLAAPMPFLRGAQNDRRDATEWMKGVRRRLKGDKVRVDTLDALLADCEVDLQATENFESHAGPAWASSEEVEDALNRIVELDAYWTCASCQTRVWKAGRPPVTQCRCGGLRYPPTA